jgi:hypothetical protein
MASQTGLAPLTALAAQSRKRQRTAKRGGADRPNPAAAYAVSSSTIAR